MPPLSRVRLPLSRGAGRKPSNPLPAQSRGLNFEPLKAAVRGRLSGPVVFAPTKGWQPTPRRGLPDLKIRLNIPGIQNAFDPPSASAGWEAKRRITMQTGISR